MSTRKIFDINNPEHLKAALDNEVAYDKSLWNKSLKELSVHVHSRLKVLEYSEKDLKLADSCILNLCFELGGIALYLPDSVKRIHCFFNEYQRYLLLRGSDKALLCRDELRNVSFFDSVIYGELADISYAVQKGIYSKNSINYSKNIEWVQSAISIYTLVESLLLELNQSRKLINDFCFAILNGIGFMSVGRGYYLGQAYKIKNAIRDDLIYRSFNGNNIRALCLEFRISEAWLYRAIRSERKRLSKKRINN